MTLTLEILTPEKILFSGEADEVLVQTENGQIAILPHHVKLMTKVTEGEIIIKKGNKDQFIAATGGFLEVGNNKVTILADYALESEDIQVARAQAAKDRAEKLMKEKLSDQDFAEVEAQMRRALMELKISEIKKKRNRSPLNSS